LKPGDGALTIVLLDGDSPEPVTVERHEVTVNSIPVSH
jgi:hypothetical protein